MRRVVAALGVTQIVGYGSIYYAFPILAPHVAAGFGVAPTLLFGAFSVGLLAGGLAAPLAGRIMDRRGSPWLMTRGSLAAAGVMAAMAAAPGALSFAAGVVLLEIVAVAVLYDAAFATLARLGGTDARRAITHLTLIAGFASTLFWPLTDALVGWVGWRATLLGYAGLHLTICLGLHLWIGATDRRGPAPPRVLPAARSPARFAPLPAAEIPRAFRAVAISFALTGALVSAFGVHMVPVLAASGLGAGATAVAMLVGPSQVAIRLVDAVFWRNLHPLTVAAVSALALPVATVPFLAGAPALGAGIAFAACFGIGQGLSSIVRGSVPLSLFGPEGYGARLGRLALIRTVLSAGAPFGFAALMAAVGPQAALAAMAALGVAAAAPLLMLRTALARARRLDPLP
jgi:hypothetical protein